MNNCIYCQSSTQGKVCMSKSCQNKKKSQHYYDNIEHYREIKRAEEKRNGNKRKPQRVAARAKKYYSDFITTLFTYAQARAKEHSLDFDLSKEFISQLYEIQDKKCVMTGLEFQLERQSGYKKRRPFAPSLDRIDCTKGYTKNNIRIVCSIVNIALSDFGDQVFDIMCEAYVNKKKVSYVK